MQHCRRTQGRFVPSPEEWELETIRIIRIVQAKDFRETLPHPDEVWKSSNKPNNAIWLVLDPFCDVRDPPLVELL